MLPRAGRLEEAAAEVPQQLRPCVADTGDAASLTLRLDTASDRYSVSPGEPALPQTVSGGSVGRGGYR